jgi:hypothetical protein
MALLWWLLVSSASTVSESAYRFGLRLPLHVRDAVGEV